MKARSPSAAVLAVLISISVLIGGCRAEAAQRKRAPRSPPPPPPAEEVAPSGFSFTFKAQDQQTVNPGSYPNLYVGTNLEYNFYKSISLAFDIGFLREFRGFGRHTGDGISDPVVSLTDKEFWKNKEYALTLKASLGVLLPVSTFSRQAGMVIGGGGSFTLRKDFTERLALSYILGGMTYYYDYDTAYEDEQYTVYNTHFMIVNRLMLNYDATKTFHLTTQGSVLTYNNLENNTYYTYIVSAGLSYDVIDGAALDFGARAGYKNQESPITWNGPTTADRPFNGEGVTLYLGFTLKM